MPRNAEGGYTLEGHKPNDNINCKKKAYLNEKAQTEAFHKQWSRLPCLMRQYCLTSFYIANQLEWISKELALFAGDNLLS